jgi:hypothetical protein
MMLGQVTVGCLLTIRHNMGSQFIKQDASKLLLDVCTNSMLLA